MTEQPEVVNTHEQLRRSGGGVAIKPSYTGSRTQYFYGWAIYRVDAQGKQVATDPKAAWYDYGKKVFSASLQPSHPSPAAARAAALEQAKKWVAEQGWYEGEWARNRMRDYVPKEVNKKFPLRK